VRPLRTVLLGLLATAATALPRPAAAWTADEAWRTVETEHYRIHYPADTEAWALDLARRADAMRERVAEVVGWQPERPTELVVMDPWGRANGFAIPFARMPLMGVFPTAPGAESGIGNYRLWAEDLVVHEDAHLLHLSRPSRNPLERVFYDGLLGVPAIAAKSPGWVIEGYATLVEGILTGAGRPNSDGRATFLRMLAREGQLPVYDELDGSSRWRGRSMRYLVGSAYLEWLAAEHGDDSLPKLWARMSARESRSFEEAFEGVFGEGPAVLYGRFVAETTAGALAVERAEDGTRWRELGRGVGAPAVSPSGEKVAVVHVQEEGPPALVVLEVAVDEEAREERAEDIAEMLEKDPQDVAPVDPRLPPHAELHRRQSPPRTAVDPRWLDETTLLFSAWRPDARGNLQPDLFTWDTETGRERRLTRQANLRQADACGETVVAVQRREGSSGLVRVDLEAGAVVPLTHPGPTVVDSGPRLAADCSVLAFLRNDGEWRVVTADPQRVAETEAVLPLPPGGQVLAVDVRPDGSAVLAAVGTAGWFDLWEWSLSGEASGWVRRTAGVGGVFSPEASADGSVFYLSHGARGFDLHRLAADAAPPEVPTVEGGWTRGVVRPPPVESAPPLALTEGFEPTPRPYGLGRHRVRLTTAGELAGGGDGLWRGNLGLTVGDLIGRSELLVLVGVHEGRLTAGWPGARAAWTLRRWRVHPVLEAWVLPDPAGTFHPGGGGTLRHHRRFGTGGLTLAGGGWGGTAGGGAAGWLDWDQALWMGPVALFTGMSGEGGVGAETLGKGHARLGFGQSAWMVGASLDRARALEGTLELGRLAPSLHPRLVRAGDVWWPELGVVGTADSATRARAQARFAGEALGVWVERVELAADGAASWLPSAESAWTVAGVDVDARIAAQPIAQVATVDLQAGLACAPGTPDSALDWQRCSGDEAWTAWLGVRVVPGAPPAYP
jgi:hypothetical protein